jgi:beta-glucanase (GH16 family)
MHPSNDPNWELILSDEFNGSQLDQGIWNSQYYYGQTNDGNNEQQYYTPDSLTFSNGQLHLNATYNPINGARPIPTSTGYQYKTETFPYRSGLISSHDKRAFTYGYMEIQARVPAGQALWPAFWMLPQTKQWPPEISIMEVLGKEPNSVYMTSHYYDASQPKNHGQIDKKYSGVDFSQGLHTFAAKWEPERLTWYIDGIEQFQVTTLPHQPMYLLANLAVGSQFAGYANSTTPLKSSFDIEYIRVYQNSTGTLHGGSGSDVLQRKNGTIAGEGGDDYLTITGNGGMYGGFGNDRLNSMSGADLLVGDAGNDVLVGGGGNDVLTGSNSAENRGKGEIDTLQGGSGSDRFVIGSANGAHYNFQGKRDYVVIQDLSRGDKIQISSKVKYRAIRDSRGFDLYVLGSKGRKDLVADVFTSFNPKLPMNSINIAPGQTLAKIFQGA